MSDRRRVNGNLVDSLGSAARHGGSALADAPVLLRRVLEEDAWREFVTQRGDEVKPATFAEFVKTPPLKGLGVDMDLIKRIVGNDPDLLRRLREARGVGQGHRTDLEPGAESAPGKNLHQEPETSARTSERLARDHPEQYAAVKSGELSINAAAVLAGIRPRRISVRVDDPPSVARSLRRHLSNDQVTELCRLLTQDDATEET